MADRWWLLGSKQTGTSTYEAVYYQTGSHVLLRVFDDGESFEQDRLSKALGGLLDSMLGGNVAPRQPGSVACSASVPGAHDNYFPPTPYEPNHYQQLVKLRKALNEKAGIPRSAIEWHKLEANTGSASITISQQDAARIEDAISSLAAGGARTEQATNTHNKTQEMASANDLIAIDALRKAYELLGNGGETLTQVADEVRALIERGDKESAIDLISRTDSGWAAARADSAREELSSQVRTHIHLEHTRIQLKIASVEKARDVEDVISSYDGIAELAIRWQTGLFVLREYADYLLKLGSYTKAAEMARKLTLCCELGLDTQTTLVESNLLLAEALYWLPRPTEAEERISKALQLIELGGQGFDERSQALAKAKALQILGNLRWRECSHAEAIAIHDEELLTLCPLDRNDTRVMKRLAAAYNGLGIACNGKGDPTLAVFCHERALALRSKLLEISEGYARYEAFDTIARSYNNIAYAHYKIGDFELAKAEAKESIEIRERLRDDTPKSQDAYAASCSTYADILTELDESHEAEAIQYYTKAIDIREQLCRMDGNVYGRQYARSLYGYARLRFRRGDAKSVRHAEKILMQGLEIMHGFLSKGLPPGSVYKVSLLLLAECRDALDESRWHGRETPRELKEEAEKYALV